MEVHFKAETEEKLKQFAAQSGAPSADELVQDLVESYFDEVTRTRAIVDRRYDEMKSGKVKGIPGQEVEAHFREKSAAAQRLKTGS